MPSIWYEAHLVAAGLDVTGVTLPSTPFVIIGHNAKLAWGLTNTGIDVQDFYVEDVDMTRRQYQYRGQWLPLRSTTVEIARAGAGTADAVRGTSARATARLLYTEAEWETPPDLAALEGRVTPRPLALRWETRGETAGGFDAINRAANWAEFLAGVRRFSAPSQNFVYADVAGHIGYAMSGRVPLRTRRRRRHAVERLDRGAGLDRHGAGRTSAGHPGSAQRAGGDGQRGDRPALARSDDARLDGAVSHDADSRTAAPGRTRLDQAALAAIQMDVPVGGGRSHPCRRRGGS